VSTVSAAGQPNLAPFSFFNTVCPKPPTVLICTAVREGERPQKDTYANIRETGEFVINFVTEPLAAAMAVTAGEFPPGVNEFEHAGLTPLPGVRVRVPRVVGSPIHFECRLSQIVTVNDNPGGGHIIIGTVVYMHIDDAIYREGHHLDDSYAPVGRTTGSGYVRTHDRFTIAPQRG